MSEIAPRLGFARLVGGYGAADVVRDVSGAVSPGEVLCVIGRNGVGKSTLLKMLFGLLPCRAGSVTFEGEPRATAVAGSRHFSAPT